MEFPGCEPLSKAIMSNGNQLYTVKWPRSADYRLRSMSGVMVESNLQRQTVLHFFNEVRELEGEIQYQSDGQRSGEARPVIYQRELADSIMIGEGTALQLRDLLNTLYPPQNDPPQTAEEIN